MDLAQVQAAITPRTRAILPVDLAGLPVDRQRLYDIARRHQLRVIEDAAQSMGAKWAGQEIGQGGDLVSFSFHANKNMTTAEGGCLVMNTADEALRFERLRLQGVIRFPDGSADVEELGGKCNLTDVAAAIGLGQLRQLDNFNQRRLALARRYFEVFPRGLGLELPPADFEHSNWHMFQPLLPRGVARGDFIARMRALGFGVGVHYPAMHLFTLYRKMGHHEGQFPHAEDVGQRTITLPLFPAMKDSDVERVCAALPQCLS
jgi:dTDP-4-amino-4,6-dideoxygalactose transaminase